MPIVNGTLTDFGLDPMAGNAPRVRFRAASPAFNGLTVLATKTVEAIPAANGFFEVDLASTETIQPATHYVVQLAWTDLEPSRKDRTDTLPWKLYVPEDGGALGDLLALPSNPANVWTGTEPPPDPTPGTWWYNPDTGDLSEWS